MMTRGKINDLLSEREVINYYIDDEQVPEDKDLALNYYQAARMNLTRYLIKYRIALVQMLRAYEQSGSNYLEHDIT